MIDPRANQQIDSILQLDLDTITFSDIHWRYGTFWPYPRVRPAGCGRKALAVSRKGETRGAAPNTETGDQELSDAPATNHGGEPYSI